MTKKIIALTDYKNRFGSKHFDQPYRSGMDKELMQNYFNKQGYEIGFKKFADILNGEKIDATAFYIYTSSEDVEYLYKNFIEDVVLHLEDIGCKMIPGYKYLHANNNKVFMELLRNATEDPQLLTIRSFMFGVKEELLSVLDKLKYPLIIKASEGASGAGVYKATNENELLKNVDKVAASKNFYNDVKEIGRAYKHKGYIKESRFRKKFIIQNMIEGLKNDWKVYYYFDKLYVFYRPVFEHRDFRASGGGYDNYMYDEEAPKPAGFFEYIKKIIKHFNVPHASLDIAWDGENFHLIEIQFLYFGTAGIPYSKGYYQLTEKDTVYKKEKLSIEEVYVNSICRFIEHY